MSAADKPDQETFKPFSWLAKFDHTSGDALSNASKDVGSGIQLVLQIIEESELAEDSADRPFLHRGQRSELMRLAITSAKLLSEAAEQHIEWTNDKRLGRERSIRVKR